MALWAVRFSPRLWAEPKALPLATSRLMGNLSASTTSGTVAKMVPPLTRVCRARHGYQEGSMCADPIPSTLPMPPTCKGPVCTAVPGARELTPAAFMGAPMSVFMVVRSRESALMKWGCSKTWEWGRSQL